MTKPQLIPYFETSRYKVRTMVELAGTIENKQVADLGAGDGRISIAFAKAGAKVDAFELDEGRICTLRKNIVIEKLENSISIKQENFWDTDFSQYDIICIYPMPDIMETLREKIKKEAQSGTKIITNYYFFENWKPSGQKNNVFLYEN